MNINQFFSGIYSGEIKVGGCRILYGVKVYIRSIHLNEINNSDNNTVSIRVCNKDLDKAEHLYTLLWDLNVPITPSLTAIYTSSPNKFKILYLHLNLKRANPYDINIMKRWEKFCNDKKDRSTSFDYYSVHYDLMGIFINPQVFRDMLICDLKDSLVCNTSKNVFQAEIKNIITGEIRYFNFIKKDEYPDNR